MQTNPSHALVDFFFQEGDFEMKHVDTLGLATFNVAIAPFSLTILEIEDSDADITL